MGSIDARPYFWIHVWGNDAIPGVQRNSRSFQHTERTVAERCCRINNQLHHDECSDCNGWIRSGVKILIQCSFGRHWQGCPKRDIQGTDRNDAASGHVWWETQCVRFQSFRLQSLGLFRQAAPRKRKASTAFVTRSTNKLLFRKSRTTVMILTLNH